MKPFKTNGYHRSIEKVTRLIYLQYTYMYNYMYVVCSDECNSNHQPKSKDLNLFKRIEVKGNITFRRASVAILTEYYTIPNDCKNFLISHTV